MIARVIFPFRGAEIGGSHVATFTLARALERSAGLECVVLCPANTLIMAEAQRAGFRTLASGEAPTGRNNLLTDVSRVRQRQRLLAGENAEAGAVVHCNDINTLRAWGLPARLNGMRVVYHHHALNRLLWPPHLIGLASADAVICVSDSTLAAMKGVRPDAVKELNPFELDAGFDRAAARAALITEFGWPKDAHIVGWVGNFWDRKRPGFFLETAAALASRDSKARFVMFGRAGDWSVEQVKRRAAALDIASRVAIPGFRPSVEANLASLDLLLAPAPREPFGRALVEAIILGTPIVATRGAGHSEIISTWGGGELAVEGTSPALLSALCQQVLSNREAYQMSGEQRRDIAAELAPGAYAGRVLGVYQRITRSTPAASRAPVSIEEDAVRRPSAPG